MTINCCVCGVKICDTPEEFQKTGAYSIQIGERLEIGKDFCRDCVKELFIEIIERIENEI